VTSRPTVLFDATAVPRNVGGVGRYVEGLLPELARDPRINLVIVVRPDNRADMSVLAPGAKVVVGPKIIGIRPLRLIWEQVALPGLARSVGADVIHSPHYTIPLASRHRSVVTLHDATFFSDPLVHGRLKRLFFRFWTRLSLRAAARIIVPSTATRNELRLYLHANVDRTRVVHHGVDLKIFHGPTASEIEFASSLVGSTAWIAFLGTLEPRKNIRALVHAFSVLDASVWETVPDLRLALAGAQGWDEELATVIADSPLTNRIVELGYVPIDALPGLLGGARVVCYPSLGEGFGLPVLEAMACEALVLTTKRLALPEVGADAVVYTETDPASIAAALSDLLTDKTNGASLRARAGRRARTFSWGTASDGHIATYREIVSRERVRS
jgi:glycosyltransferase involved in cell wall biosynthesis